MNGVVNTDLIGSIYVCVCMYTFMGYQLKFLINTKYFVQVIAYLL